jgi:FAD/FMN-containing dehydrogenase
MQHGLCSYGESPLPSRTNFGGNQVLSSATLYEPRSEAEVLEILDRHRGESIRAIGRLHSWSDVLKVHDVVIDLRHLDQVTLPDEAAPTTAVLGAGLQIKNALRELRKNDLTLPSLGLITEQSIAGATATGTHGSGKQSLSHFIQEVTLAHYDSDTGRPTIRVITEGDELQAARCSLGCLGIILSVKLTVRPVYRVEFQLQEVGDIQSVFDSEAPYPLQQTYFLPWRWSYILHQRRETTRPRTRLYWLHRWYWLLTFDLGLHWVLITAARILRAPRLVRFLYKHILGKTVIQRWNVVDNSVPALTMEHEWFRHIEIEMFVTRSKLPEAMQQLRAVLERGAGIAKATQTGESVQTNECWADREADRFRGQYTHHYPICLRKVLPDDTLISMSSSDDEAWYAISLISYESPDRRQGFFAFANLICRVLMEHCDARPHWGKVCPITATQASKAYPRLAEFIQVREALDPEHVFSNDWLKQVLPEVQN